MTLKMLGEIRRIAFGLPPFCALPEFFWRKKHSEETAELERRERLGRSWRGITNQAPTLFVIELRNASFPFVQTMLASTDSNNNLGWCRPTELSARAYFLVQMDKLSATSNNFFPDLRIPAMAFMVSGFLKGQSQS